MVGAEQRPDREQFAETGAREQSGVHPLDALIERQRLNLPDIGQYYDMWVNMHSELYGDIPPEHVKCQ